MDSSPDLSPFLLDLDLGSKDSDLDLDLKAMDFDLDSDLKVLPASPFSSPLYLQNIALSGSCYFVKCFSAQVRLSQHGAPVSR